MRQYRQYISILVLAIVASSAISVSALDVEVKFEAVAAASRAVDLMTVAPIASDTPMVGAQFVIAVRFDADFSMSVLNSSNVSQVLGDGKTVASFKNDQPDEAGYSVGRTSWTPTAVGQYHIHVVPADGTAAIDKAAFQVIAAPSGTVERPKVNSFIVGSAIVSQPVNIAVGYTADANAAVTFRLDKENGTWTSVTGTAGAFSIAPTFTVPGTHTIEVKVVNPDGTKLDASDTPASNSFYVAAPTSPVSPVTVTLVDDGTQFLMTVGMFATLTVISPGVPSSITVDWGNGTFVALECGSTMGVVSYIVHQFGAPGTFTVRIQVVVNGQTVVLTKTVKVVAGVPIIVVRQPFPFRGKNLGDIQYMSLTGRILNPKDPNDQALFQPLGLKFTESPTPDRFNPRARTFKVQSLDRWWYWRW